jgi:cysteine desulfurase
MERIYLDHAATAPLYDDIADEMRRVGVEEYGNPSSLHSEGKRARTLLYEARQRCAGSLEVPAESLVFTSGGSESNAIPLSGLLNLQRRGRVCISDIEHPAVWEYVQTFRHFGFEVETLHPDERGIVTADEVERRLSSDTVLVALMAVNNETGAIQPVREAVRRVRAFERSSGAQILVHCDAVQALGKIPLAPDETGADTVSFSGHKLGGPKGTGLLYHRRPLQVISPAGGQEGGLRGGTENLPGIHALSLAVERSVKHRQEQAGRISQLKQATIDRLRKLEGLRFLPPQVASEADSYSPFILSFSAAPVPGEVLVRVLNDRGFAVSTGSACSSNNRKKRHRVMRSMGTSDEEAAGSVRLSFGPHTEEEALSSFCSTLERELPLLQKTAGKA